MTWDDVIMNAISQPWAESLATDTSTTMEHASASSSPSGTGYGENLAWFSGYDDVDMERMRDSVDAWYKEVDDMDWTNVEPGSHHSGVVGHFTCLLMYKHTRRCYIAKDKAMSDATALKNKDTEEVHKDQDTKKDGEGKAVKEDHHAVNVANRGSSDPPVNTIDIGNSSYGKLAM